MGVGPTLLLIETAAVRARSGTWWPCCTIAPIFICPFALVLPYRTLPTKTVYPLICRTVLPVGMLGMVIAAMFSADATRRRLQRGLFCNNDLYKRLPA